ncbi:MAG: sulfite exporter TauE/SafE family protein [Nitrososphaerota archaeon]
MDILTLMLISIPSGLLGAIAGLGGGIVLTPILVTLGVPIKYAIASSMVAVIGTSSGSAAAYVRGGLTNLRVAMFLEMFTIAGAVTGAILTVYVPSKPLYFVFASFLIASLIFMRKRVLTELPIVKKQDRLSSWLKLGGSYFDEKLGRVVEYKITNALWGGVGMIFAGIAGGMLGIGAGIFKVSILELIMKMPSKPSSTTSNFVIGMTALAGAGVYLFSGLIQTYLVAPVIAGMLIGSMLGARILNKLSSKTIRIIFVAVLLYSVFLIMYKGLTL